MYIYIYIYIYTCIYKATPNEAAAQGERGPKSEAQCSRHRAERRLRHIYTYRCIHICMYV